MALACLIFVSVWFSPQGTMGLTTPALSCFDSMLTVFSLPLSALCLSLLICWTFGPWDLFSSFWISDSESGQCLCPGLCRLASKVLLNCHWCVLIVLCVLHDYSSHLCHLHLIWLHLVVFSVVFNDSTMHPGTPSSIWTTTVDPEEKSLCVYHYP